MVDSPITPIVAVPQTQYSPAFLKADAFTAMHEGGYNPKDSNGYPSNFGINQKAHPEVDVKTLTPEQARAIRYTYWKAINGDSWAQYNPKAALIAYDTAILAGPKTGAALLMISGGDPDKMMKQRMAYMSYLVQTKPELGGENGAIAKTWSLRNTDLGGAVPTEETPKEETPKEETPKKEKTAEPTVIEKTGSALEKGVQGAAQAQQAQEPLKLSPLTPQTLPSPVAIVPKTHELYQNALARSPIARAGSASAPASPAAAPPPVASPQGDNQGSTTKEPVSTEENAA